MPLSLELAIRFLRRRSGVLLRGTALAALLGVALATAAMVVTLALMRGYSGAIAAALQRGNAHVVGFAPVPMAAADAEALAARLAEVDGVLTAVPVSYLTGLLTDPSEPTNPVPVTLKAVAQPPPWAPVDVWPDGPAVPVVVGARLGERIGLGAGDRSVLRLPPDPGSWIVPAIGVEVIGSFRLEFAEFDDRWLVGSLGAVARVLPEQGVAGIELMLDDPLGVAELRPALEDRAPRLLFSDWRDMNRTLFTALRWQTLSLFVVLSLVVAVSSFQVSSALVVLAIDKRRSAGMLQALGATPATIRRVLLLAGTLLGSTGIALGLGFGSAVSWALSAGRVIRFSEGLSRVYMIDSIPLDVQAPDLAAVAAVGGLLVTAASLWPSWRTSREDPIAALRAV